MIRRLLSVQHMTRAQLRTRKGEVHEAFNIGLDPSLGLSTHAEETATDGSISHSENLWPPDQDWDGAEAFVSNNQTQD